MSVQLPDEAQRRLQIERAFRVALKLKFSPETELRVSLAAEALARMVDPELLYPNAFRDLGGAKVGKELQRFASQVRKLRYTLHMFHKATITRLADVHIMRSDIEEVLYNIEDAMSPLETIAETFEAIDASDIPAPTRGKSTLRGRAVASHAALQYKIILGQDPSITNNPTDNSKSGRFIDLLTAVFEALAVEDSVVQRAQEAVDALIERRKRLDAQNTKSPL